MVYKNPVVKGFYPDPSVCFAEGRFYMVCSSFQYFPGVPLFESGDLVNWTQIGHVLTRETQVMLDKIPSSGGVFAPTIRYNNGRFYMVTTNDTLHKNFYVYTDDIHGEWSEPVFVDQGGIDPSLYFEDGRTFFISNGADDSGTPGVVQCEINIETGEKLSPSKTIWQGSGGRFLESPHMYKIDGGYYLMAAEGGTEYGHMITYARSDSVWGEFEGYAKNPVLTNRNKAPYIIQGIGHGDLIQDQNGDWHILCLGFRQIGTWQTFHNLGREVFLVPVNFGADGWFTAGKDGTCDESYEIKGDFEQVRKTEYTFENTDWNIDWCRLRKPADGSYELSEGKAVLHGTDITLDDVDSPTFIAMRQKEFCFELSCNAALTEEKGEGGLTVYMSERAHYDVCIRKSEDGYEAALKLRIGCVSHVQSTLPLSSPNAKIILRGENYAYKFFVDEGGEQYLGYGDTKYLSSEADEGFTGVMLGLYAVGGTAEFNGYNCKYK